jgi:hypothetical protein
MKGLKMEIPVYGNSGLQLFAQIAMRWFLYS